MSARSAPSAPGSVPVEEHLFHEVDLVLRYLAAGVDDTHILLPRSVQKIHFPSRGSRADLAASAIKHDQLERSIDAAVVHEAQPTAPAYVVAA